MEKKEYKKVHKKENKKNIEPNTKAKRERESIVKISSI